MDIVITVEWAIAGLAGGYLTGTATNKIVQAVHRHTRNRYMVERQHLTQLLESVRHFNNSHDCAVMWTDIRPIETAEVKH